MSRNVCLHADACCGLPAAIQSNRRNPLKSNGSKCVLVRNIVCAGDGQAGESETAEPRAIPARATVLEPE